LALSHLDFFFLSDGQKIHFLYPPPALIFGRRLLLESLCERVPTSQHSPAHRSSKGWPSAPSTRRMYRYTSELALFFYNKGEKCIDDGHDLSDTARLSVSVRLLHTTTAQHRQYRWGSPAATAKQPKGSSSLATTTTTTTDWRKKKLDKNWAGPPLFPCRWIGVSFNIPSLNIVSVFFLLHGRNLSTKCVCMAVYKQLGSIRFDWAAAQMIERYRLVLNDRVYPVE
jgi:hypothetical protein